jgi:hypothetical protein
MQEFRETHVERDPGGRDTIIIERPRKGGGFGWGMLFGALLMAAVVIGYSYSQGSFQRAGGEADQLAANVEQSTDSAIDRAREASEQDQTSETATN